MTDELDELGRAADRLDNLIAGCSLPLPAAFHLEQITQILPEISAGIKKFVVEASGENPWSEHP